MRVVFIGCVESSYRFLQAVLREPSASVVGVITRAASKYNSDFVSLSGLAEEAGAEVLYAEQVSLQDMESWICARRADVIYCFGWSSLLPVSIFSGAPLGTIGFHPASLPMNRGRHPIIWALALGLSSTASTFFRMQSDPDSGPILAQENVLISEQDDARSLYDKILEVGERQVEAFTRALSSGAAVFTPQDESKANVWRKRGKIDGRIDWRMTASSIYNLVRALTRPYPGAYFEYQGLECKVWRTEVVLNDERNIEPGKVLDVDGQTIVIKCGSEAIRLLEWDGAFRFQTGEYV